MRTEEAVSHIWLCNRSLGFPYMYMRKFFFFFICVGRLDLALFSTFCEGEGKILFDWIVCDCLGPLGWSRRRGQESLQWSSHQGKRAQVLRIFIPRVKNFLRYEVLCFSCNFLVSGTENYNTITSGWLRVLRRRLLEVRTSICGMTLGSF
jgi:hypothetical protein